MRRDPAKGLGHTQQLVLHLLASGNKSADDLEYDWPGLTESMARGAIARLADRGLVDVAGWTPTRNHGEARTYCLTAEGEKVEQSLVTLDDPEEDVDS